MCLQNLPAASGAEVHSCPEHSAFPFCPGICSHLAPGWVRLSFTGSQSPPGKLERPRPSVTLQTLVCVPMCGREPRTSLMFARIDGIRGIHRELACLSDTQSHGQGDGILRTSPWKSGKSQLLSKFGSLSMIPNPPDQLFEITVVFWGGGF